MNKDLKILIVEDEVITGMYLEMMLKKEEYNIVGRVGTGEKAIKIAEANRPDVILMDIRLAGKMDGLEAARQIMAFSQCYIIFMTGYQVEGVKQEAEKIQPCAFLVKPVNIKQIVTEIKKYYRK